MIAPFLKGLEAKPHTPIYKMHKYFARRPWNVFSELISHYTSPGDIVLDPFCGGGVTVVECLRLRRRVIGVDVNPLAKYVTEMEVRPVNIQAFEKGFSEIQKKVGRDLSRLYQTRCRRCKSTAIADWIEWDEKRAHMVRIRYFCPHCCAALEKTPDMDDLRLTERVIRAFPNLVREQALWFPETPIPHGDKTDSLHKQGLTSFQELFTKRNLLALALLLKAIEHVEAPDLRDFLLFAFSGTLKWASRMSHLRGDIVEGWAMHAYWIYPRSLEINVWKTFERRVTAVSRGKEYSRVEIGAFGRLTNEYHAFENGTSNCLLLNQNAAILPMPDNSVDAIITDPPYGANVNYGELSDYWVVWLTRGRTIEKGAEAVINRSQGKSLADYENLLYAVLAECYRVLRPGRFLVSTFNSKSIRVVSSFIMAVCRAGFKFQEDHLQYQPPIRAYTTTFHAIQVGAFVGDFIFTFTKPLQPESGGNRDAGELTSVERRLDETLQSLPLDGMIEPQVREKAYKLLIPFLASNAQSSASACLEAVEFFEARIRQHEREFASVRKKIVKRRRRTYSARRP